MAPLVALTTDFLPEGGSHRKPQVVIYAAHIEVLRRVGLMPVLVTPAHGPDSVAELMESVEGLVLSGGGDVQASLYGEEPGPALLEVVPERDAVEMRAVEVAVDRGLPILGICRGLQVLNVYFGGTLHQDLPAEYGGSKGHEQDAPWGSHHHEVTCSEGSRIHRALAGCEPLRVNSHHHQAVKALAPGLVCTARAADGLVEGVEHTEHPWVVGVQWHPERHEAEATDADPNIRIMQAFARQVLGEE